MSREKQHSNLAARMGRWSAGHWKTATFGWLALVVVAFAVGGQVGTKTVNPNTSGPGESGSMDRILHAGFKLPANESILIQSRSARAGTSAFDSAIADVRARVSKVAAVSLSVKTSPLTRLSDRVTVAVVFPSYTLSIPVADTVSALAVMSALVLAVVLKL